MAQNEAKHSVDLTVKVQEFEQRLKNAEGMLEKSVTRMSSKPVSLKMDDSHVNQYYKNLEAKQKEFAVKQQLAEAALVKQRRISTMQNVQLAQQVQDFGIQVAGGQNPLLAAVQQGSQLHFIYGSLGNVFRALTGLLTPLNIGLAALAGVAYGVYKVFVGNQEQLERYNKALQVTGNFAGATAASLENLVRVQARTSTFKSGNIRDAVTGLAATGQFNFADIAQMSESVLNFARITGKTEQEVAQHFANMKKSPADFAREMLLVNGRLSADEVERIRKLEESGQKVKAGYELQKLVIREFGAGTKKELSDMDSALSKAGKAWDEFWSRVRGTYVETDNERLAKIRLAVETSEKELGIARSKGIDIQAKQIAADKARAALQTEISRIIDSQNEAQQQGEKAARERQNLEQIANKNAAASAAASLAGEKRALDLVNKTAPLKAQIAAYEKDIATAVDDYQKAIIQGNINELERKVILEEINKLNEDYLRAGEGAKSDPASQLAVEQNRLKVYQQMIEKWQSLFGKKDAATLLSIAGDKDAEKARQDRLKELEKYNKDAEELSRQLSEKQKEIEASYITDIAQKAKQELEIEAEKYKRKIELAEKGSEERKKAEEEYLKWYAAREAKINDELTKRSDPARGAQEGVKGYLEGLKNKGEQAKAVTENVLKGIEDSMVELLQTGKLNAKSLVNTIIAEFYRLRIIKPLMAEIFGGKGGGGDLLGSFFGGLFGGGSSGDSSIYSLAGSSGSGVGLKLPGRASGGNVAPYSMYQVNERGTEMLSIGGKDFLMTGANAGYVTPANMLASASGQPIINVTIDSSTDRAQVTQLVQQGVTAGISNYHNQVQRGLV